MNVKGIANWVEGSPRKILFLLVIFGFILRLSFIFATHFTNLSANWMAPDSEFYVALAKDILEGHPLFFPNRLIADFIACFHTIGLVDIYTPGFENRLVWIFGMFNTLWSTLSIYLYYYLVKYFFNQRITLIATLIFTLYPYNLFWNGFVLKESFGVFLFIAALLCTTITYSNPKLKEKIMAGLLLLLTIFIIYHWRRSMLHYLFIATAICLFIKFFNELFLQKMIHLNKNKAALLSWLSILVTAISISFFSARFSIFPQLYDSSTPNRIIKGNGYVEFFSLDNTYKNFWEKPPFDGGWKDFYYLPDSVKIQYYIDGLIDNIKRYPFIIPYSWKQKFQNYFRPVYKGSSLKNILFLGVADVLVMLTALLGFVLYLKKRNGSKIIISLITTYILIQFLAHSEIRYRIYDMPIYIMLSAFMIDSALSFFHPRYSNNISQHS
ncbi:MAG: hypothetical protein HQK52_01800 [Oligoflexia bacterium]|nr:hypothetical protein [Oligoflexia bacterium]